MFSLRIDDHPATERWTTPHSERSESSIEFEIPLHPVAVPPRVLAGDRALFEWAMDTHGFSGRLLLWDEAHRWWMAQDSGLEIVVTCAPQGVFAAACEAPSWLPFGTAAALQELEELRVRYGGDLGWVNRRVADQAEPDNG